MNNDNNQSYDLETAQNMILKKCAVLPAEELSLSKSLNRFPPESLTALADLPGYDQSLRDGYAIGEQLQGRKDSFAIIDEVAAGDIRKLRLSPGKAIRIMTGGLIPEQCIAVVPKELCTVTAEMVTVEPFFLGPGRSFIHYRGSELAKGKSIVRSGAAIRADQLILLAGVGYDFVPVVRKPRVGFFCTGSELVTGADKNPDGKKFSANSHLLHGLIEQAGAELRGCKTVMDDPDAVLKTFTEILKSDCDIIISTGGMGPGKFDLVEEAFSRMGGEVIYRSLQLRPGKSTLFGMLGSTLFFGMPGPPPAVHLLFNELIRPAILALQGAESCRPKRVQAFLTEGLSLPGRGLPRLKSGLLNFKDGKCLVRPAGRVESSNCYIDCPAIGKEMKIGDQVTVHMTGSLPCFD